MKSTRSIIKFVLGPRLTSTAKAIWHPKNSSDTKCVRPFLDIDEADLWFLKSLEPYTMTSIERRYHLLNCVRYIVKHDIPGDIVECGVWRGGSMMLVARALLALEDRSRGLFLFDTFEGMPPPSDVDTDYHGKSAQAHLNEQNPWKEDSHVWALAQLSEVTENMAQTNYPADRVHCIAGRVEETVPAHAPERIAILRLDTDWYESTKHELDHLYSRVSEGGVIIFDDYGWWKGARKAVDEFLESCPDYLLLHRLDDTGGRGIVKITRRA